MHTGYNFSGQGIVPAQRPLPDITQHLKDTYIHTPPLRFEPAVLANERPQTYALERVATICQIL